MSENNITIKDLKEIGQSTSLKLIKLTKGYNWEIRILELDVDKLEKLNNDMLSRFGGSHDESY